MPKNFINRGSRRSSPLGSTIFVCARGFDPFLQHAILANCIGSSLITSYRGIIMEQDSAPKMRTALLEPIKTSPYRPVLLSMAIAASAKHIFWRMFIAKEEMSVGIAITGGIFNAFLNSINSLLFVATTIPAASGRNESPGFFWSDARVLIGLTLFVIGITVETVAEIQRKAFKDSKEGQRKPFMSGMFGWARHVNYGGYTLWRAGYALTGGGQFWFIMVASWFIYDFSTRAIPGLDEYCAHRVSFDSSNGKEEKY